ncbi:MAG: sigma-54 dependent transcriptional regulator [Spirochaetia bacterium]|nr:sigma-54 dependent transcriptional regulator [Spirochaetia bacterium]
MNRILVVEDEKNIRESLETCLSEKYEVRTAVSAEDALGIMITGVPDLLITDLRLPGMSGIDLLKKFREMSPTGPVIIITAFSSIQNAVEAMKAGADEYIPKPFSLEEIEIKTANLLSIRKLNDEKEFYASEKDAVFGELIGTSPSMQLVKQELCKVAHSEATVLITGETGTGKELVAYTLHKLSGKKGPFVPVHCAAYAKGVIESELFGHEKGAFTGADRQRKGKIEYADQGTLFLDEVGDIPPDIQVKLLRVLENRTFERVGSNRLISSTARVVCATNRNLEKMIQEGTFREDLYYRINVFPVTIPPLRERRGDIMPLAGYFASKKGSYTIDRIGAGLLASYAWPGNVRELQNIIERAAILAEDGVLRIDDALGRINNADGRAVQENVGGLEAAVESLEKKMISDALKACGNNQSRTAAALKINRTTLQYKIQKYGL